MNVSLVHALLFCLLMFSIASVASDADELAIRFVGAYQSDRQSNGALSPLRVIAQRGHDLFLSIEVPQSENVRKLEIEGGPTASLRIGGKEFKLVLESKSKQSVVTQANRRGSLQLCYTGVPDYLADGQLSMNLKIKLDGRQFVDEFVTNLVLVESRPINPGLVDGIDVVKEAVGYASGNKGASAIAVAMTDGLFSSDRFRYDDKAAIQAFDTASGSANLKPFSPDKKSIPVNCYQISTYLGLLLSSVGIDSELREIVLDPEGSDEYAIITSPAISLGTPNVDGTKFEPIRFYSHQFLVCENRVYDASYAVLNGLDGKESRRPILGWTLDEYLGGPYGNRGQFITGLPSGKPAKLFVNAGEIPAFDRKENGEKNQ